MCSCITEMDKALDDGGYNTVVGTVCLIRYSDTESGRRSNLRTVVEIASYVKEKKRGAKAIKVTPLFCPFCGEKYEADSGPQN